MLVLGYQFECLKCGYLGFVGALAAENVLVESFAKSAPCNAATMGVVRVSTLPANLDVLKLHVTSVIPVTL